MSTWEQAMIVAEKKAFAERAPWIVLGHPDPNGPEYLRGWCYHAWRSGMEHTSVQRSLPPRERL